MRIKTIFSQCEVDWQVVGEVKTIIFEGQPQFVVGQIYSLQR